MTSATERLRALLDERGVEHYDGAESTLWLKDEHGYRASADEVSNGMMQLHVWCATPAQAIDATLGRGTCHPVFEVDAMSEDERVGEYVCSECGETFGDGRDQLPNYCPNCGRMITD